MSADSAGRRGAREMVVYVVTAGDYSAYHIIGVTADKEKAEKYCEWYKGWSYDEAQVEEYEMDKFEPYGQGKFLFEVEQFANGYLEVDKVSSFTNYDQKTNEVWDWGRDEYFVPVFADDEDHAKKIAADLIARYKWERSEDGR